VRRVGQVVLAAVAVMAVAVLARPSEPRLPQAFEIERGTPRPRPSPDAREPTPEPEPTAEPRAAQPSLTVHRFDPQTFVPLMPPRTITLLPHDFVATEASPDGRYLAVMQQPGRPRTGTILQIYRTDVLAAPIDTVHVPVTDVWPRFSSDSERLLWVGHDADGASAVGGLRIVGEAGRRALPTVALPGGIAVLGFEDLAGGRVGVHGYALPPPGDPAGQAIGPVRLLVVDLDAGEVTVDVTLPTAPAVELLGDGRSRHLAAGIAWDRDRDRAYVAHADRDAVLVVDLPTGEVVTELTTGEAGPTPSPGEEFESVQRFATLGPDGARLYVHGAGMLLLDPSGDLRGFRTQDLPLLVADLDGGRLERAGDVRGRVSAVSPDGASVALVRGQQTHDAPRVLQVLAAGDLELRWEVPVGAVLDLAFTPDGEHLLVFSEVGRGNPGGWRLVVHEVAGGEGVQGLVFEESSWQVHLQAGLLVETRWP
jgi:hypothetical protein